MFWEDTGLRLVVIVLVLALAGLAVTDIVNRWRDRRLANSERRRTVELESRPTMKPKSTSDSRPPVEGPARRTGV